MPERAFERLRPLVSSRNRTAERAWREWCFLRAVLNRVWWRFVLLFALLLGGGLLFQRYEPEQQHPLPRAMYYTWALIFAEPPEAFPTAPVLQVMFFLVPVVGLVVILEGLVEFAFLLRDRRRNERSWCRIMSAAYSDHIILVGLGKLGIRSFRLLRRLGLHVVVIERNAENQFLDEVREEGSPLFVGDARREKLLDEANAAAARSIILASNDDLTNLEVALDARRINPRIRVVLRMFDQNMADKIRAGFNIQIAISQSAISAPAFVTAALEGGIVSSVPVGEQLVVMQRWTVVPGGPFCDCTVGEILTQHGIGVVERQGADGAHQLMPPPVQRIQPRDELLVQGAFQTLTRLRNEMTGAAADARPAPARSA